MVTLIITIILIGLTVYVYYTIPKQNKKPTESEIEDLQFDDINEDEEDPIISFIERELEPKIKNEQGHRKED